MNRFLILASILCVGLVVAVVDTHPQQPPQPPAATPPAGPPAAVASPARLVPEPSIIDQDAPYLEACARENLSPSACVGRLIWYKATGGNDRFHTYTFQQRIGVLVDWYRVLR